MYVVALTGAGVSTFSGIPTFRGPGGIYQRKHESEFTKTELRSLIPKDVKPSIVHKTLAQLYVDDKLDSIITQNIDGLHQEAGVDATFEMHGNLKKVTMYGDQIEAGLLGDIYGEIYKCDVLLVLGTSLEVQLAYDLVEIAYERGCKIITVNKELKFEGPKMTGYNELEDFCNKLNNGEKLW